MEQGQWQTLGQTETKVDESEQEAFMQDVGEDMGDGAVKKRKPWERLGPDGRPIKRKPNPHKRNMIIRKAVFPKNSVVCLNDLQTGLKYNVEKVENIGNFLCSVEVNGETFTGYGSSKDQAKQAAAESALMSFVKPPPPKPAPGEAPNPQDDATPWKTIASFAIYKLFREWKDNKMGAQQQAFAAFQQASIMSHMVPGGMNPGNSEYMANLMAHLNEHTPVAPKKEESVAGEAVTPTAVKSQLKPISESKLTPEKIATSHPVMILHQMCPTISYTSQVKVDESGAKYHEVSAEISGQLFMGQGAGLKKAKQVLAKSALKTLYGVENVYGAE